VALGKSVGRISIRVVPDATKFRNDLKLVLKRAEQSLSANIAVTADTRPFDVDVRKLVKEWSGKNVALDVDAKTLGAKADLALLTRRRVATVDVKVSKGSLLVAAQALATLSGARVSFSWASELLEQFSNLDKTLPKFALATTSIGSLVSVILSSVSGLLGIGAGLSSLAPGLLILPGLFAGAALSVGVLVVALSQAKTQLAALSPAIAQLKRVLQDNFWAQARKPIIDLVQGLMPQLRASFAETSKAIGSFVGSFATSLSKAFGGGRFQDIFGGLPATFQILSTGTDAFANTIASLSLVAAKYVPQIAQWFVDASFSFDTFLTNAANSGQLDRWMSRTKKGLADIGRALIGGGRILNGVWKAAVNAGGRGLGGFADNLERVATAVNGAKFQAFLTALFSGASQGTAGLAKGLSAAGDALYNLRGQFEEFLRVSGGAIGGLLANIAKALNTPKVTAGLDGLLAGLKTGIDNFSAKLPDLSGPLGSLLTLLGSAAPGLGSVLGQALSTLATAAQPLLDALSGKDGKTKGIPGLLADTAQGLSDLKPKIEAATKNLQPFVDTVLNLAQFALPQATEALGAFFDGLGGKQTGANGKDPWSPATAFLNSLGGGVLNKIQGLGSLFDPSQWVKQIFDPSKWVGNGVSQLIDPIGIGYGKSLGDAINQGLGQIFNGSNWSNGAQQLGTFFAPLGQAIQDGWSTNWGIASGFISVSWSSFWNGLSTVGTSLGGAVGGIVQTAADGWSTDWANATSFIGQSWNAFWSGDVFTGVGTGIANAVTGALSSALVGIQGLINGAIDMVNGFVGNLNLALGGVKQLTGGAVDLKVGKIPHVTLPKLAIGADILAGSGGVAALLGEGGRNERVIDQGLGNKQLALSIALARRALATGGSGGHEGPLIGQVVAPPGQDARVYAKYVGRELDDLMNGR
jgi:hypothetical protein